MSPVRLIILAILFYIGYLLLRGMFKGKDTIRKSGKTTNTSVNGGSVNDVLVEDPFCHKLVPKQQAVRLSYKQQTHYFCSEDCCNSFVDKHGEEK